MRKTSFFVTNCCVIIASDFPALPFSKMANYKTFELIYANMQENLTPEVSLWRAVILQSILDRLTQSTRGEDIMARKNAKNWMNIKNDEFRTVCEFAQLEADFVIRKAEIALVDQAKWRRRCDIGKGVQFI
jgi:hypothetical protein